eukprot:TRINITY_DN12374_c0_g1_i1.p1 TRINITY_DN12374_c0_g1~~TRINITY_DN12374_c0_g1_i1.p1  ORF type:complete len:357 (+),score=128.49 TRINITY_DN12374_c0_g1_i1:158-1228(+)
MFQKLQRKMSGKGPTREQKAAEAKKEADKGAHWEVRIAACKYHADAAILDLGVMSRTKCDPEQKAAHTQRAEEALRNLSQAVAGYDCSKGRNPQKLREYLALEEALTMEFAQAKGALDGKATPKGIPLESCVMDPLTMTAPNMTCVSIRMLDSVANIPYGDGSEASKSQHGTQVGSPAGTDYALTEAPTEPRGASSRHSSLPGTPLSQRNGGPGLSDSTAAVHQPLAPPMEMLDTALAVQDDATQSLHRSEALTYQMQDEAREIQAELRRQAEMEELIQEDLHLMQKQVKTARREVHKLSRKLGQNKCFICLCIFVMIFVILTIVLRIFNPVGVSEDSADPELQVSNVTRVVRASV